MSIENDNTRLKNDQRAVSEVLGEVMMIGIAVLSFTILAAVIFSVQTPNNLPRTDLAAWVDVSQDTINIQHRGGETLDVGPMEIILSLNDNQKTLNSTDIESIMGSNLLQLGDIIVINTSSLWGIPINQADNINMIIIFEDSILNSGTLLGTASTATVTFTPTPTPTPTATPTPTPTPTPSPTPPAPSSDAVYTEGPGTGWSLAEQNATAENSTTKARTGALSLKIDLNDYGLVRFSGDFDTTGYTTLEFYITGQNPGGQVFNIYLSNSTGDLPPVAMTDYITGGFVDSNINTWQLVSIPLADLAATSSQITGITIQENVSQKTFYIDDMYIK